MIFKKNNHIGQYTVVFPHKQGSYAETYRVKDTTGKTRFLKFINYSKLNRHQFDDNGNVIEVEIAKHLNHHNLCTYMDSGCMMLNGGQSAYLVTGFVSGETLSQRIARDGERSVYEIKQIAKAVLSALQWLHSQPTPIIHGDVTIQNVLMNLVGETGDLKLIGFGHAHYLGQPQGKPDLNELNAFYLAPECFSGVYQVQSDLYSVGVLMYQLVYGGLPWFFDLSRVDKQDRVDALLAKHDAELDFPQIGKYELDDQLVNIIAKALCYDVEGRFQTAEEFIKAINGDIKVERQSTKKQVLSAPKTNKVPFTALQKKKGAGFDAIAGMEDLKRQMREEILEPLQNPEEYHRYGVTIPNGMLLYGPPGCGKTFFAKHFAEEVGFNFVCITPASLKSRFVNATQENIAKMFKEAEEKAPTMIFIDEMNELVPNRDGNDVHEMSKSAVNEMLAQMDRTGEKGVFVIGATNYPNMIDPAILRAGRLDKKYYIGVPDAEARMALFKLYLETRPYDFGLNYKELASLTENYVSADIQLIVNDASRNALRQHSKITMGLLKAAITNTRPSLSANELRKYEHIRAMMNGEPENKNNERRRIGF